MYEAGRLLRNDRGKCISPMGDDGNGDFGRDVGVVGRVRLHRVVVEVHLARGDMIASRPRSIDRSGFLMNFKNVLPLASQLCPTRWSGKTAKTSFLITILYQNASCKMLNFVFKVARSQGRFKMETLSHRLETLAF